MADRGARRPGSCSRAGATALAAIGVALVASLLALGPSPRPAAAVRMSPATSGSDQLLFDSNRTGNFEIFLMGTDGRGVRQLTDDPAYDSWWPVGSPDGTRILFYRNEAGSKHPDYTSNSLWVMDADGGDVHQVLAADANGWGLQGHAEWSPDGTRLVMFGGPATSPQLQVTAADGTGVTTHRDASVAGASVLDPEWGRPGLTYVSCPTRVCKDTAFEIYRSDPDGGDPRRLTDDDVTDNDPSWSPDGTRIAWLRKTGTRDEPLAPGAPIWAIYLMGADGSDQRAVIDDGNINSKPAWSTDGSTIYFHRLVYGGEKGFQIWRIAPDGTGLTEISGGQGGSNEFPVVFVPAAAQASPNPSSTDSTAPSAAAPTTSPVAGATKKNPLGALLVLAALVAMVAVVVAVWRRLRRAAAGRR
ncbi:MAG: TolB family protein [Acidimicrobiales bacterium]